MANVNHLGDGRYRCVQSNGSTSFFNVPQDGNINAAHDWAVNCQNAGGIVFPPPVPFLRAKSRFSGADGDAAAPAPVAKNTPAASNKTDWKPIMKHVGIGILIGAAIGFVVGRKTA